MYGVDEEGDGTGRHLRIYVFEGVDPPMFGPGEGFIGGIMVRGGGGGVIATLEQSGPVKPSVQTQVLMFEQI